MVKTHTFQWLAWSLDPSGYLGSRRGSKGALEAAVGNSSSNWPLLASQMNWKGPKPLPAGWKGHKINTGRKKKH